MVGSAPEGLEARRAERRRAEETSRIKRVPVGLTRAALDELANPLTPLLGAGAALSAAVGSVTDAGLVLGVVGVNALVGAAQRCRPSGPCWTSRPPTTVAVRVIVVHGEEVRVCRRTRSSSATWS